MAKEEIPEVLYRIAEMVEARGEWEGTMSQLLEEIGEHEMTPNVLSRKIAEYGCMVFDSKDIQLKQIRTSKERRYIFHHRPKPEVETVSGDDIGNVVITVIDQRGRKSSIGGTCTAGNHRMKDK